MKRLARAKRRDLNEPLIVEALQSMGARVVRLDDPADLLVGYKGFNILMEVKNPDVKGKQRPKQIQFENWWRGQYVVIETVEEALTYLGEL